MVYSMRGHKSKPNSVELMTNVPIEKLSEEKQNIHLLLIMYASIKQLKYILDDIRKILKIVIQITLFI